LDHIVDEAEEGDEAAADQARLDQLIAQDRQNTKAVIEGITNGYDASRRAGKRGEIVDKLQVSCHHLKRREVLMGKAFKCSRRARTFKACAGH
jgi:hypothetical protein